MRLPLGIYERTPRKNRARGNAVSTTSGPDEGMNARNNAIRIRAIVLPAMERRIHRGLDYCRKFEIGVQLTPCLL